MGVRVTTSVYATKRALFDKLREWAVPGQPLEGISVDYAWNPNSGLESIYGGGVRFTHTDAIAEHPGVLVREEAWLSLYVRVAMSPPVDVSVTDERAEEIGSWLGALLRANPGLAGGGTWLGMTSGQGDYQQVGEETVSILAYQVRTARNLAYGGG